MRSDKDTTIVKQESIFNTPIHHQQYKTVLPNKNQLKTNTSIHYNINSTPNPTVNTTNIQSSSTIILNISILLQNTNTNTNTNISTILKPFFQKNIPTMPIDKYLIRIYEFSSMHINTVILSLILIDRFCEKVSLDLIGNTIYKILLAASLIAYKYNEDIIFNNKKLR